MLLTAVVLFVFVAVAVGGVRYCRDADDYFMSRDYTTVMKGLCCVIVVLVHIPVQHGNPLQDLAGSFAQVCVTLFFMFSAYGLKWSIDHKDGYLDRFLKDRVLILLIPYAIVFVGTAAFGLSRGPADFVLVLLLFYAAFYLSYRFLGRWRYVPDIVICATVLLYSLANAQNVANLAGGAWPTEAMGFAEGILLARFVGAFRTKSTRTYAGVVSTLSVTSLVLGVLYLQYKYIGFTGSYLLRIVLDLSLILLLLATTTRIRIGNPWSRYLGTISYEVFLSHAAVMGLIERTGIALSSGEFVVCTLLGTIVLASVLHFVDARISWRVRNWGRPAVRGQPMRAAFLPVPAVRTQEPGDRGATGATPLTDGLSGRLVVAALEAAQASLDAGALNSSERRGRVERRRKPRD